MHRMSRYFQYHFKASGLSLEKLIRLCEKEEIPLYDVQRVDMKGIQGRVGAKERIRFAALAAEKGWQAEIGAPWGLSCFQAMLCNRKGLIAGVLAGLAVICYGMQFIWQVDILNGGAYAGDIRAFLSQQGIQPGITKKQIELEKIRQQLEWRYPQTAWVYADLRGGTLVIRLVEGVPPPRVETEGEPGDVTASRSGMIVSVEPAAGTALVEAGQIVQEGQVLIQGVEKRGEEITEAVKARGRVLARVWDRAVVRLPLCEAHIVATGREQVTQRILTPLGAWGIEEKGDYERSEIILETWPLGGVWWPVQLQRRTRREIDLESRQRDQETVRREAEEAAWRLLRSQTGDPDEVVDKWADCCIIESGIMEVCAVSESVVDIAENVQNPPP